MMNKKVSLLQLILISTLFFKCTSDNNKGNHEFMKIGNFSVSKEEFYKKQSQLSSFMSKELVFDDLISAGLVINKAEKKGYEQNVNFRDKIRQAEVECKVNAIKNSLLDLDNIKEKEVKNSYKIAGGVVLVLDFVRIPREQKDLYLEIWNFVNGGRTIINSRPAEKMREWKNSGVLFYNNITVRAGYFTNEVEKVIFKMEPGSILTFDTKRWHYVIKLRGNLRNSSCSFENQKKNICKRLATAKQIELKDLVYEDIFLDKVVQINTDVLSSIDFSCAPLAKTDKKDNIIANYQGKDIDSQQLVERILRLQPEEQILFRNKKTRKNAIIALITKGKKNTPLFVQEERTMLQRWLEKEIKSHHFKDTISFLIDWIESKTSQSPFVTLKDGLLSKVNPDKMNTIIRWPLGKYKLRESSAFPRQDYSFLLLPKKSSGLDKLSIDFLKLEKLKIPENKTYENHILARKGKWKLSIMKYKNILSKLTPESRVEILTKDNPLRLIEYIAHQEGKITNTKNVTIDHRTLGNLVNAINKVLTFPDAEYLENDTVGSLYGVSITINELRWKVFNMSEEHRNNIENKTTRESAFRDLLIQEFWLHKGRNVKFEEDAFYQKELKRCKNNLLAEFFYQDKIFLEPLVTADEHLNFLLRVAFRKINQKRLEQFLIEASKAVPISVDKDILNEFKINVEDSKFSHAIHFMKE